SFELRKLTETKAGNYEGIKATITISKNSVFLKNLYPEKRMYFPREMVLSEAAIYPSLINELYIALGEPLESGWSMRIYIKPYVRLIWLGGLLMALGGMGALIKNKTMPIRKRASKTLWLKKMA
ncbi:MAG TPA: cytochrome c-type biogenesis CcmF C-terminal domain-containing protein, partial [Gammaproteobacteria bacterium]|nr:cytochrome c-type biogenesis CcmF C-terminal domain-containing protein [Gammaproteobacteria bacterium]